MDGGPWLFCRAPVIIQEYDGFSDVSQYKLNKVPVWERINGLQRWVNNKRIFHTVRDFADYAPAKRLRENPI